VTAVKCKVVPLTTGTDAVRAADRTNVPAEASVHSDPCVIVSDPVIEKSDIDDRAMLPPDAAANVTAFRVVTTLALAVPAAPGSPV
jgi:hypothetical protein